MEHFRGQQLQDAVNCSQKFANVYRTMKENSVAMDVRRESDKIHEETRRLPETTDSMEEIKRAISGVKEMKHRERNRKDNNINVTREVFT